VTRFLDAYAVLGVGPGSSAEELKRAHRALVRQHHPDLQPAGERAAATRRVQEINVAYGLVRAPEARARYDRVRIAHLAAERAAAPVRRTARAVREADSAAAGQWEALVAAAGVWAGRWWQRHRFRLARGAGRVRRAGLDLVGRVLWLVSCVLWLLVGLAVATTAQRFAPVDGVVLPLAGAALGVAVGHRRGWRRRLRLAGLPDTAAHRVHGWRELVLAALCLGALFGVGALLS
jgi:predicted secreted protein